MNEYSTKLSQLLLISVGELVYAPSSVATSQSAGALDAAVVSTPLDAPTMPVRMFLLLINYHYFLKISNDIPRSLKCIKQQTMLNCFVHIQGSVLLRLYFYFQLTLEGTLQILAQNSTQPSVVPPPQAQLLDSPANASMDDELQALLDSVVDSEITEVSGHKPSDIGYEPAGLTVHPPPPPE